MENRKAITILSISLVTVFVLIQSFKTTSFNGAWCSPYLGAPIELGHPAYQPTSYGFPFPFVTAARQHCFTALPPIPAITAGYANITMVPGSRIFLM